MNQASLRRIQNETNIIKKTIDEYRDMFVVRMVDDNMYHWEAILKGPPDSLYEGYNFKLDIFIPSDYPNKAPKVKFITPIQHLNINSAGDICLDILKDEWTASQNIISVMISIRLLLSYPNADDPFNSDLILLYRKDKMEYEKKIRECCEKYKI